jgi:hypothetical protein
LQFWHRKSQSGDYKYLPLVVRILFALPSSSAQIERDFGVCGDLVSSHRTQLSDQNIDMASFINRNRNYLDVTQCPNINPEDLYNFIPPNIKLSFEEETDLSFLVNAMFAQDDDDEEDEDAY